MSGKSENKIESSYHDEYNPEDYLVNFYSGTYWKFNVKILDLIHKAMQSGQFSGERFADICCGPCIHGIISSSRIFNKIYMLEYYPKCREAVEKWIEAKDEAFDWSPFIQHVADLEGVSVQSMEKRMRKSVRAVISCDLSRSNAVDQKWMKEMLPLDCILTSFTLECFCENITQYEEQLVRFSSFLKPKGGLLLVSDLAQSFYVVGKNHYFHFSLNEEMLINALMKAGFSVVQKVKYNYREMGLDEVVGDAKFGIFIAAVKQ